MEIIKIVIIFWIPITNLVEHLATIMFSNNKKLIIVSECLLILIITTIITIIFNIDHHLPRKIVAFKLQAD